MRLDCNQSLIDPVKRSNGGCRLFDHSMFADLGVS